MLNKTKGNEIMTTNMLNLPSFKILDMKESEYDYRFLVETTLPPPSYCPKCGTVANLYKHGKKEQLFFDLPMHAKRVGIFVKRQRYKCNECGATFFESLPDIDEGRLVSVISIVVVGRMIQMDSNMVASLLPQAATTAIAVPIAESIGGISSLTAFVVVPIAASILGVG